MAKDLSEEEIVRLLNAHIEIRKAERRKAIVVENIKKTSTN